MPSGGVAEPLNSSRPSAQGLLTGDETFTEDYGESTSSQRTSTGGVDFFSSLGTERKRPPRPDKLDPDKVQYHCSFHALAGGILSGQNQF